MRAVLGIVSLLIVLAVVGVLASRQLTARAPVPVVEGAAPIVVTPGATPQQQSQQIQEQVTREVTRALEQGAQRNNPDQ